jgi:hypothetical protein
MQVRHTGKYYIATIPLSLLILPSGSDVEIFDNTKSPDYSDPDVCYFRVAPVGVANAATSLSACASQIYFFWGGNGTRDSNGALFADLFDNELGAEVHAFDWSNSKEVSDNLKITAGFTNGVSQDNIITNLEAKLNALPYPIVLFGQSFGGSTAVAVANDLENLKVQRTAAGKAVGNYKVAYMGLFDPVQNPEDYAPQGVTGSGTESFFHISPNVLRASDWWRDYADEKESALTEEGIPLANYPTIYTGPISNANETISDGSQPSSINTPAFIDYPDTGTIHVSQDDHVTPVQDIVLPDMKIQISFNPTTVMNFGSPVWLWGSGT